MPYKSQLKYIIIAILYWIITKWKKIYQVWECKEYTLWQKHQQNNNNNNNDNNKVYFSFFVFF